MLAFEMSQLKQKLEEAKSLLATLDEQSKEAGDARVQVMRLEQMVRLEGILEKRTGNPCKSVAELEAKYGKKDYWGKLETAVDCGPRPTGREPHNSGVLVQGFVTWRLELTEKGEIAMCDYWSVTGKLDEKVHDLETFIATGRTDLMRHCDENPSPWLTDDE